MERDELAGWLHLTLTLPHDGAAARRLLAAFGPPSAILAQDDAALAQVLDRAMADALRRPPPGLDAQLDATLAWLDQDRAQRDILALDDPRYPAALLAMADPPLMLYRLGRLEAPPQRALAIVGSRNPTPQGANNARESAIRNSFEFVFFFKLSGLSASRPSRRRS